MIPTQIKDGFITTGAPLGSGNFGDVVKGKIQGIAEDVAVKFERKDKRDGFLLKELEIFRKLKGIMGFPKHYANGHTATHRFIAMELLGPSLGKLFKNHNERFSLVTVQKIGIQILDRLEILHGKNVVHSDLKPDNVMVGLNDQSTLFLADFGLAVVIPDDTQQPHRTNAIRGTLKYMGLGAFEGIISYKNDVESLAFMLCVLVGQRLPWEDPVGESDQSLTKAEVYKKIYDLKKEFMDNPPRMPMPLRNFLAAVKDLNYLQRPDYEELRQCLT